MDTKGLMNEMGGAFAVSWLIFGATVWTDGAGSDTAVMGMGLASLGGMFALMVAWMAFNGAHILPPITWMNIMTSDDMSDTDMWMNNGLKLVAQVVGAALAIVLMAEVLEWDMVTYAQAYPNGQGDYEFDAMAVAGLVVAGAILGHISSKVDNDWAMPVAVMAMAGLVNFESAADMASMLMNETDDLVVVLLSWLLDGAFVGVGAFMAGWIDENL